MIRFQTTKYKVPSVEDKRIVMISDIHYYDETMKTLLDKIILKIQPLKPDYICIPGDFIDERYIFHAEIFLAFLASLGKICPTILSVGNHEVKTKKDHQLKVDHRLFEQIRKIENVFLLDNASVEFGNLRFTGITFPYESYKEEKFSAEKTKKVLHKHYPLGLERDKFNIVLSHSPYVLLYPQVKGEPIYQTANLILSGHTHAGLTPTFLAKLTKRVLITPERHLFPKNSYGYLKKDKTIVSSGITKLSHFNPFRDFNFLFPSEIVILELKKEY